MGVQIALWPKSGISGSYGDIAAILTFSLENKHFISSYFLFGEIYYFSYINYSLILIHKLWLLMYFIPI